METQQVVEYLLKVVFALLLGWGFLSALAKFVQKLVEWLSAQFTGVAADIATAKTEFAKTWGKLAGSVVWTTVWMWIVLGTPLIFWLVSWIFYLFAQIKLPDLLPPGSAG